MAFAESICGLVESRLSLAVESEGAEDDWNVVGPAILAAAARHLRVLAHLQETFPSAVIGWQVLRSLFEYVATYMWVAADPEARAQRWLKHDYVYRLKLDNDFRELGEAFVEEADRHRVENFLPNVTSMPDLVSRASAADDAWAEQLQELQGHLPENNRSLRQLYPVIFRSGSRFTHPSSHVVDAFVTGDPPQLAVGEERPLERDLVVLGAGILAAGLAIAVTASPALELTFDEIRQALEG